MIQRPASLVDILRWRARNDPDRLAYRFLRDGESDEVVLTYAALDHRARAIGALLQSLTKVGDRALLLFPPGLDFITAYFGCLYAGVLAIPTYPPHPAQPERNLSNLLRIAADAKPSLALLPSLLFDAIIAKNSVREEFGNLKLLATDRDDIDVWSTQWRQTKIETNDLAFLQYTSGSTTTPKGVMVSHGNLLHNLNLMEKSFGVTPEEHSVIWLPPFHDMGLIGGLLQPVYSGMPVTLIPHLMFLQRPFRWLQAISRCQATISGGPNFAFDLCVRKIKPEQRELLDLRNWQVAFVGAEPVYHKTLEQFADYFAPCGFRKEAFLPCYGLAESTLMVVGVPKFKSPVMKPLLNAGLQRNEVSISNDLTNDTRTMVGCGTTIFSDQQIRIVNAETHMPCLPGEIGEIWVSSPSVAQGYWEKPAESEYTFGARLADSNEGPFLRTGDLGFLDQGELFITGRLKNLIISEGRNHYSHDIERTVESAHPFIRQTGCAVFSIFNEGREEIIVVAEIEHRLDMKAEEVKKAIREAISMHHGLHVHDIKLTKPGGIPKTTSGKIRHFLCREYYLAGYLKENIYIHEIRNIY